MVFLELVVIVVCVLFAVFMLEQVLVPLVTGQPVLWRFRKVGRRMRSVEEELSELELERRLEALRAELERRRQGNSSQRSSGTGGSAA